MSFVEVQFPTDISYGAAGGPEFSTEVIELGSGFEKRNQNWSLARARYNVAYGIRNRSDLKNVKDFFYARKGRAVGFRYKDWADYIGSSENIGVTSGSVTDFQLRRVYSSGGVTYYRNVLKPVPGTHVIYLDAASIDAGSYSVDSTTGILAFNSAPSAGQTITADFEYDVPVRFDVDWLPETIDTHQAGAINDIPLLEVKL